MGLRSLGMTMGRRSLGMTMGLRSLGMTTVRVALARTDGPGVPVSRRGRELAVL